MNTKCILSLLALGFACSGFGQGAFSNLNFESARVVVNDPTFGFLDWSLAAPGWSHSTGNDTSIVYYRNEHLGFSQYYLLYDSISPVYAPGTQLGGRYSLGFASGHATGDPASPWVQAYLSQTGLIPSDAQSIRFSARGSFQVFVGGVPIAMQSLGGSAYAGDVSSFAGTAAEFRIVNTSMTVHDPVVADNFVFSSVAVPEPSIVALVGLGVISLLICRKRRR